MSSSMSNGCPLKNATQNDFTANIIIHIYHTDYRDLQGLPVSLSKKKEYPNVLIIEYVPLALKDFKAH